MLKATRPEDVAKLIGRCDDIAGRLKMLRAEMIEPGPRVVELNVEYAITKLDSLVEWADGCLRKRKKEHAAILKKAKRTSEANGRKKKK